MTQSTRSKSTSKPISRSAAVLRWALLTLVAVSLAASGAVVADAAAQDAPMAEAQRPQHAPVLKPNPPPRPVAQDPGPAIAELRIAVQDIVTKEQLGYVNPGDVLTLEVGRKVRLRMVAIPGGSNRAPRYPSTRFSALAGGKRIQLSRVDQNEGSAIVTAVSTVHHGNNSATTLIEYQILEPINYPPGKVKGTITIDVVEEGVESEPDAPAQRRGITLFEHSDYRGRSETFYEDDRRLNDNYIRQDTATSIQVDEGCEVTLYEHPDYAGRSSRVKEDIPDLRRSHIGSDTVSSLEVVCYDD